jgi:phosphoesterase RecJ-like protein
MNELFSRFWGEVSTRSTFVITTHINPDGDALGSEVGLAAYLASLGKQVIILNHDGLPGNFQFLQEIFPITVFNAAEHEQAVRNADAVIVVDGNALHRIGALENFVAASRAYKICIDHHPDRSEFADLFIIDTSAAAAGEIIYQLLAAHDPSLVTAPVASGLYVAIMTDTGSFRFPMTDSLVHQITAELLRCGADPSGLFRKVFEEGPASRVKLLGRALSSLEIEHNGSVAALTIRQQDFAETGSVESDTDTMINHTLTIGGVRMGLLFVELPSLVKIGFRSRGDLPVNELAKCFGGNGHKNAAGARVYGRPLKELKADVFAQAKKFL